jgi:hypothetical protein
VGVNTVSAMAASSELKPGRHPRAAKTAAAVRHEAEVTAAKTRKALPAAQSDAIGKRLNPRLVGRLQRQKSQQAAMRNCKCKAEQAYFMY